jgi:hypothetical protein
VIPVIVSDANRVDAKRISSSPFFFNLTNPIPLVAKKTSPLVVISKSK